MPVRWCTLFQIHVCVSINHIIKPLNYNLLLRNSFNPLGLNPHLPDGRHFFILYLSQQIYTRYPDTFALNQKVDACMSTAISNVARLRAYQLAIRKQQMQEAQAAAILGAGIVVTLLVLVIIFVIPRDGDGGTGTGTDTTSLLVTIMISSGSTNQGSNAFGPNPRFVSRGATVRWVNLDNIAHTATSNNGVWDSGIIPPGSQFSRLFVTNGSYAYHCSLHPNMAGTLVVV